MSSPAVAGSMHARNVAVIATNHGPVIFADRVLSDAVQAFDLEGPTRFFVGRAGVFARLEAFAAQHDHGYVEVLAEAGLGKTALAAQIAKGRNAIVFLASVGSGTRRAEQFLEHACAELILRYGLERTTLPANLDSNILLTQLLREAVERAGVVWMVVDGLDEAEPPPPGANPLLLPTDLPQGVFVVVTRRHGELRVAPDTPVLGLRLARDDSEQVEDVRPCCAIAQSMTQAWHT